MNLRKRRHRRNKGFTLLEVLLVMAILIILMSLGGVAYFTYFGNAQVDACRVQMRTIEQAVNGYRMTVGRPPATLQDLVQLPSGLTQQKWKGPYLDGNQVPVDPWGNPFKLEFGGDANNSRTLQVILRSRGPNGIEGDADDVSNMPNDPNNQ